MALHVFVAMPFGVKEGIDFNRVYAELIKPALSAVGYTVFRADEDTRAGNIRTDMFQELLLADMVVADLSIDNPNVWYELGVRHALRARGVVQIKCRTEAMPFDVYTDRSLRYHIKAGVPDPERLEQDKRKLADMAQATMAAWRGRKESPVYHHLRYLKEPDWKSLRIEEAKEFWDRFEDWNGRVEVARQKRRPGDIMLLAEQAPTQVLRVETYAMAARALMRLGQFPYALEQVDRALELDASDLASRQLRGTLLGRMGRYADAKVWLEKLVRDYPNSAESWALLGRAEKDAWIDTWRKPGSTAMREDAAYEEQSLKEAIEPYATGFKRDPTHYYSGINALSLMLLYADLIGDQEAARQAEVLAGGVRWSIECALARETVENEDFYARISKAELELLTNADVAVVERAYKHAVAGAERDWFALDSAAQQLALMEQLAFRPAQVAAAGKVLKRALDKLKRPQPPRKVFLFSGHMIDAADRSAPRFPADKEAIAQNAIEMKLQELDAGPEDLAISGGACGGDLLFAEACLARGLKFELRLAFEEAEFIERSVSFAGERWLARFRDVKQHPNTQLFILPDEIGASPVDMSAFEFANLWLLYTALSHGAERLHFLCLWNRGGGDGPGGTEHMYDAVKKRSGHVYVLDTRELFK